MTVTMSPHHFEECTLNLETEWTFPFLNFIVSRILLHQQKGTRSVGSHIYVFLYMHCLVFCWFLIAIRGISLKAIWFWLRNVDSVSFIFIMLCYINMMYSFLVGFICDYFFLKVLGNFFVVKRKKCFPKCSAKFNVLQAPASF